MEGVLHDAEIFQYSSIWKHGRQSQSWRENWYSWNQTVSELGEGPSVFLHSSCPHILINIKGSLTAVNLEIGFTGHLLWNFLMFFLIFFESLFQSCSLNITIQERLVIRGFLRIEVVMYLHEANRIHRLVPVDWIKWCKPFPPGVQGGGGPRCPPERVQH